MKLESNGDVGSNSCTTENGGGMGMP